MKLVLLCPPQLGPFERAIVEQLTSKLDQTIQAAVIDCRPPVPLIEKVRSNLRKGRGGYLIVMAVRSHIAPSSPTTCPAKGFLEERGIAVIQASDPYSARTLADIRAASPDAIVLVGGFGIVKRPLLDIPPRGILSYHHGDMRRYRGQPPGYWELYNGESSMGITVQRLSVGLDCGDPVVERSIDIRPAEAWRSLRRRAKEEASVGMMGEAVDLVSRDDFVPATIEDYGEVYTLPNLRQWVTFNLRISIRVARRSFRRRVRAA